MRVPVFVLTLIILPVQGIWSVGDVEPGQPARPNETAAFSNLTAAASSGFRAPVKNGEGTVHSHRFSLALDRTWRSYSSVQGLSLEGSRLRYNAPEVSFLDEAGSIHELRLGGFYNSTRDGWQPLLLGSLRTAAASGSSFEDGLYFSGGVGVQYPVHPRLTLGIGALGGGGTNDRLRGYPWLGVRYRITEQWTVETRNGVIVSFRPHPAMPRPTAGISLLFEVDRFATTDRDDLSDRTLTVRDRSWVLRGYATFFAERLFPLRLILQTDLNRRIRLMESGRSLERIDLKPRPVVGIETGFTF